MTNLLSRKRIPGGSAEMIAVALPMVVSLSCDTMMTFTDRWFLSKLGEDLMNAAFIGGLSAFVIQTFFTGLIGYSTAMVAQEYGAGRTTRCRLATVQAMWVALLAWPLLLLAIPAAHYVFPRLGLPAAQIGPQLIYFDLLVFAGSILGLMRGALSGYFSGLGKTRVVMCASLAAMISNVFLVWVLVFGHLGFPAMGITGAAIGTICAGAIGLGVLLRAWFASQTPTEKTQNVWRMDRTIMGELLRKGTPSGIEFFLNMLAFQSLVLLLQRQGPISATAATIMFNWDLVSFVPLIGIEIGTTSLVGRYIGAQNPAAVRRTLGSGIRLGLCFSTCVLLAFLLFPGVLVDVFRPEIASTSFTQARELAINMVRVASIYIGTQVFLLVFAGALRGAGDTFWAMCATVSMHWTMVAVLWFALEILGFSTLSAWMALIALFLLYPLVLGLRWKSGHWRKLMAETRA